MTTPRRKTIYEEMEAELEARKKAQDLHGSTVHAHAGEPQVSASPAQADRREEVSSSDASSIAQTTVPSAAGTAEPESS